MFLLKNCGFGVTAVEVKMVEEATIIRKITRKSRYDQHTRVHIAVGVEIETKSWFANP